uniref:Uncharacterized protein LOC114341328 n=1 Tax=Diabrotica virgifera virgifera TaxID=50390 RepID=A0A6P7GVM3_DIAVI
MKDSNTRKKQGDNLQIIRKFLSIYLKNQSSWLLPTWIHWQLLAIISTLAILEAPIVIGGILLYNKYGTLKALVPFMTTFTLSLPVTLYLLIFLFYIFYRPLISSKKL